MKNINNINRKFHKEQNKTSYLKNNVIMPLFFKKQTMIQKKVAKILHVIFKRIIWVELDLPNMIPIFSLLNRSLLMQYFAGSSLLGNWNVPSSFCSVLT